MADQSGFSLPQFSSELAELMARVSPSTVRIRTGRRSCTGFLVRNNIVVTASDALEPDGELSVSPAGAQDPVSAQLVGRDPTTDIALLKLDGATGSVLPLDATTNVATGNAALVVGQSRHGATCAFGVISLAGGPWESMRGGKIDRRIRLDLRLEPHQEGGPVLNAAGQCIGMVVFGPGRTSLAIPSATIERIATELLAHGRIRRGYLGVAVQRVSLQPQSGQTSEPGSGLMVLTLERDGPAHRAGILQGDIIIAIDGRPLSSSRQLHSLLGSDLPGRSVPCEVIRASRREHLSVSIGESPVR